jgi:dTDP-4-dehydrorhamnose reductase
LSTTKLVITGASGTVGYHLIEAGLAAGYEVYGLYRSRPIVHPHIHALPVDITDYISLGNVIEEIAPDMLIHAAALADANPCQQQPELSYSINVEASAHLAGICADHQIPMVFTSTDLVFDGQKGGYLEIDIPTPILTYGIHKLQAEAAILAIYPQAWIARCPLMFGKLAAGGRSHFTQLVESLRAGQSVQLFHDEYRSICPCTAVARGIVALAGRASGILHLGGSERLSRYEFGILVADVLGVDHSLVIATSQRDVLMPAPRPADVSLDSSLAMRMGYEPGNIRASIDEALSI